MQNTVSNALYVCCGHQEWKKHVAGAKLLRLLRLRADPHAVGPAGSAVDVAVKQGLRHTYKALLGSAGFASQRRLSTWHRLCWCCSV
ncbi:hypothetical protein AK812_SmicGene30001 [Symbiodinium microadriaticum]|uniref:Uncharacterized protein n=1 Tax=Symbiodinium microadriaticum TaxID=2951 RepID=A0A1Q9D0H0_SYMMI|nr:hypothetical protein AK812_SmicGene30001 [Symbiodinium microadriaticum]